MKTLQAGQRYTDLGHQDMLIVKVSANASPPPPALLCPFSLKELGTNNDDISSQKRILKIYKSVEVLIYTYMPIHLNYIS